MEYVYFVYNDNPTHLNHFYGRIGIGKGKRYKDYITPYGHGYNVCVLITPERESIEREILEWGRKNGYFHMKYEILNIRFKEDETIKDAILKYKKITSIIIDKLCKYGEVNIIRSDDQINMEDDMVIFNYSKSVDSTQSIDPYHIIFSKYLGNLGSIH